MNWLRKIWNWIQSSFHKDLPDPVNEVYAVRMDDVINERPRASGGEIRRTELTYHFDTGPSFNEISIVPGPDENGEFFTDQTVFDMSNVLRGPVSRYRSIANGVYVPIYEVRFDNTEWMKNQIQALEDKGLA